MSPLFELLGYRQEQEAAGFGFVMFEGVRQHHAEADLAYLGGDEHDVENGHPLEANLYSAGTPRRRASAWKASLLTIARRAPTCPSYAARPASVRDRLVRTRDAQVDLSTSM